jgi:ferredoxin-NADP reductase
MAQNPKTLQIVAARAEGAVTRVLTIADASGQGFDDVGGKYVIMHTGVVRDGKAVKRAYSLMRGDAGQGRAEIAVKRIGPGSHVLHDAQPSATFTFSGPWGKLVPETGLSPRTLLVATDTGITAALGVVEQAASTGLAFGLPVAWLTARDETFFTESHVRERIERAGARLFTAELPDVRDENRLDAALPHVTALALESDATHVIATGDGAIVHALRARLPELVPGVLDVRCECFFNNPERKSA